jgi:hypothetical protein
MGSATQRGHPAEAEGAPVGTEDGVMFADNEGPVEAFEWGLFTIAGRRHGEGGHGVGKDVRVIGVEVSEWVERKGHTLTPAKITGVYGCGIEALVIGSGVHGMLECPDDVKADVQAHDIAELRVLRTPDACKAYNVLVRCGRRAALLAHGTC